MRDGVLCAGNWIVDRIKCVDRWPGEGNLASVLSEERAPGGGPANVLFDLAAMDPDYPLYAAGRIGDDAEGEFLLAETAKRGVDTTFLLRTPSMPTACTDVISAPGSRTFFHAAGADRLFAAEDLNSVDCSAEFFYLGYLLLLPSLDAPDEEYGTGAARLLASMRGSGFRTTVDFVSGAPAGFLPAAHAAFPHTDILIANEIEAACCTGVELRDGNGVLHQERFPELFGRLFAMGIGDVAVIHFPEGAAAQTRAGEFHLAPACRIEPGEIAGRNGAGDAFAAGMLYALAKHIPLATALRLGAASSFFNLKHPTASGGAVSFQELETHLKSCAFEEFPPPNL